MIKVIASNNQPPVTNKQLDTISESANNYESHHKFICVIIQVCLANTVLTVPCMSSDLICDYITGIQYTACKWNKCHMKFDVIDQKFTSTILYGIQGHSKVFTTGKARVNPEHYVIKYVDSQ